jgi:hypothetical protein
MTAFSENIIILHVTVKSSLKMGPNNVISVSNNKPEQDIEYRVPTITKEKFETAEFRSVSKHVPTYLFQKLIQISIL